MQRDVDDYDDEPEPDSETLSLMETPEGQEWEPMDGSADTRDMTPDPPAILDPWSILRNRQRVRKFLATGEFTWPLSGEAA